MERELHNGTHSTVSRNEDQQAENLFIDKNIPEIRQVEQRTRLDIERKKEELRQMVGERYRDMIEAADSVIYMQEAARNVVDILSNVQALCKQLQQTHLLKGTGGQQAPPTTSPTQSVSAQMRLVLELQEKIWCHLEDSEYLSAALCYLIMRHTSSRMRTMEIQWSDTMNQLWQRSNSFKISIVQSCRNYLKSSQLDENVTLNTLSALVLLEGCNLEQVYCWFLNHRQEAIHRIFHSSQQVQSVKVTVREVMITLRQTLLLVSRIFAPVTKETSQLLNHLTDSTQDHCNQYIPEYLVARLPSYITSYKPQLSNVTNLSTDVIHKYTRQWINSCYSIIETGLNNVLIHVNSLKGLAGIRDVTYTLLTESFLSSDETSPTLTSVKKQWMEVCEASLGEELSLYDQFLRTFILERAKDIISDLLRETEDHMTHLLRQLVSRHETNSEEFISDEDITSYLWNTRDEQELGKEGNGQLETGNGMLKSLRMKSKGCTPQLYRFCQSSSQQLQVLVEDLHQFSLINETKDGDQMNTSCYRQQVAGDNYPFDRFSDLTSLQKNIEDSINQNMRRFLSVVDDIAMVIVMELKEKLPNQWHESSLLDRLLLLARLCQCLLDFTPSLKQLITLQDAPLLQAVSSSTSSWRSQLGKSQKGSDTSMKNEISSLLQHKADDLFSMWSKQFSQVFLLQFKNHLFNENDMNLLSMSAVWEEIKISEESESGKRISSIIRLPSQASVCTVTILYALCQEISRVGGHSIRKTIFKDLVHQIYIGIMSSYLQLIGDKEPPNLPQDFAIQLLFDFRFLSSVLWSPSEEQTELVDTHKRILSLLLSSIDPFDYDVFSSHLNNLLERQLQRSMVMFGVLFSLKEQLGFSSHLRAGSTPSTSTNEKHIVIPLSTSFPRIPLLLGGSSSNNAIGVNVKSAIDHKSQLLDSASLAMSSLHTPSFLNIAAALQHI